VAVLSLPQHWRTEATPVQLEPDPIIVNPTGFHHAWYCKSGPAGALAYLLVLKASWRLNTTGEALQPQRPGETILPADRHLERLEHGQAIAQLLRPGEKTLPKPHGDLIVVGAARIGGEPRRDWVAALKVGDLQKLVHLHGPRQFIRRPLAGWKIGKASPTRRILLDASQEFGGCLRAQAGASPARWLHHPEAPSGSGWLPAAGELGPLSGAERRTVQRQLAGIRQLKAPSIEDPANPHRDPFGRQPSVGLGPVPRWSSRRSRYLGDPARRSSADGRPCLPPDFDFRFLQAAQPDLQNAGQFRGNEVLVLVGLLPEGRFESRLPGVQPVAKVRHAAGNVDYIAPRLDTVLIDLDRRSLHLSWRWAWSGQDPVQQVWLECMGLPA
jgi:hypothetical protein